MNTTSNRHGSAVVTLPSDTEILITREFDAPADLVYRAYTEPELIKRWWGFDSMAWLVCDVDLRVGGTWRYVTKHEAGFEVGFHGEFQELSPPTHLVCTEVFEGMPDASALDIVDFIEVDGVTTLTMLVQHTEQAHRDAHIDSGMEGGMQVSMDRLEDLVGTLA